MRKLIKKILYYFLNYVDEKESTVFSGFSRGLKNVSFEGNNAVPDRCNFSGKIKIGFATTLGYNNFFHGNIRIGKYCQFGADVAVHTSNHPITYLSTYINKNLFSGELKKFKETKETVIGNDVWVGHNAIIVGGVTIGNGAIIAAGSVVTKDIEPYSIVGGVPATFIKKRFSQNVIQEIEELKWWDKPTKDLIKIKPLFFKNFLNKKSIYESD
ncbi:CatB-related O-acetyltransferase [Polaribacter sp. Z022]|uniref:CatB-related O-acetyltransferase n=1 Tax=Polaribacter sp. Z022 TaxID=2927125 RepID=UPI00202127F8|nr:CatB-related O-acetyltransferase [Polaribacter sp. Z022]MCL7753189.1 CatB-related O-acetyltransferase [Polaribacter sp. Z022]